jgi:hypothetical protein
MLGLIVAGWILGMGGYIVISKLGNIHSKGYYDVKVNIRKFKRVRDEVNGVEHKVLK